MERLDQMQIDARLIAHEQLLSCLWVSMIAHGAADWRKSLSGWRESTLKAIADGKVTFNGPDPEYAANTMLYVESFTEKFWEGVEQRLGRIFGEAPPDLG